MIEYAVRLRVRRTHQFKEQKMTKHALIIDAGCKFGGRGGSLNHAFADLAAKTLESIGWTAEITRLDDGWNTPEEAAKVLKVDLLIVQTPGWWMSTPWQFKKYEDEVFCDPQIGAMDGRSRNDPTKLYGTGGTLTDKHYLLSSTWNAPLEAFTDPKQHFGGVGIDGVFLPIHATMKFLGVKPLASFMANDVIKAPQLDVDFKRFVEHLKAEVAKIS